MGPRRREGGSRRDGRRRGHGGDARERGATDTPPSRSYDGTQNKTKFADRLKVLWWDGTGLVLASKRLEQGRFAWPAVRDGVMRLSRAQFEALFEGLDWRRVWGPRVRRPLAAA